VVIRFNPYGRAEPDLGYSDYSIVSMAVDVRGTGASEDSFCIFCDREQQDYYEVVEWAGTQPWSNGRVGAYGNSYEAIAALLTAARQPPSLKTIVVRKAYFDPYRDAAWHNGILNSAFLTAWTAFQASIGFYQPPQPSSRNAAGLLPTTQQVSSPDSLSTAPGAVSGRSANLSPLLFARDHPLDGPDYWERAIYPKWDRITVPVLFATGWYDGFSRGTIKNFNGVASTIKRLIVRPESHAKVSSSGRNALDPMNDRCQRTFSDDDADTLDWFRYYLNDEGNFSRNILAQTNCQTGPAPAPTMTVRDLVEKGPAVAYYDLGRRTWTQTEQFPPADAEFKKLYFAGGLSPSAASLAGAVSAEVVCCGVLQSRPAKGSIEEYPDYYAYHPGGVTETFSKWMNIASVPLLQLDQRADEASSVTYTTLPMENDLEIAGPMEVRFWAQTDVVPPFAERDVDWVVKVSHVATDGGSALISSGYLKGSHRKVDKKRSLPGEPWLANDEVQPVPMGVPVEYRIDLWPIADTIKPGERLRVSISSSDVPSHEAQTHATRSVIFHDRKHRSYIGLFVRPDSAMAEDVEEEPEAE
jgi:hypothetical protein